MVPSILLFLGILCITSMVIYGIGHITTFRLQHYYKLPFELFFIKLVYGSLIVFTFYAIISTLFSTILVGLIAVFAIFYVFHNREYPNIETKPTLSISRGELEVLPYYLAFLLVFSIVFYYRFTDLNDNIKILNHDYYFYSGIADFLNKFKIETNDIVAFDLDQKSPNFYHYFEIWAAAMVARVFNLSTVFSLVLVIYPLFLSIVSIGAITLAKRMINLSNGVLFFISLSILFLVPFIQLYYPIGDLLDHQRFSKIPNLSSGLNDKLFVVTFLMIWFFLNMRINDLLLLLFPLAIAGVVYPTTVSMIPGIVLFLLGLFFLKNRKEIIPDWVTKRAIIFSIVLILIPFLNVIIFYGVQPKGIAHEGEINVIATFLNAYFDVGGIVLFLGNTFTLTLSLLIPSLPFLILGFLVLIKAKLWHRYYFHIGLVAFIFISSFSAGCVFVVYRDGYQFFTNIFYPIIYVLFFALIIQGIKQKGFILGYSIILIAASVIFNIQSSNTTTINKKTYEILKEELGNRVVSIAFCNDSSFYKRNMDLGSQFIIPFREIRTFNSHYFPVDIGVFNKKFNNLSDSLFAYNSTVSSPFYQFVIKNSYENQIDSAKLLFLEKYRFDYVIINKNCHFEAEKTNYPIDKIIDLKDSQYSLLRLKWEK